MSINEAFDSLPDMAAFACVVEAGSFSAAARKMGLSPSAVSRQIARLEALLRVRLLERSTRKLRLTEAGQAAHARCQAMLAAAREVLALSDTASAEPQGLLRVSCPKAIARQLVHPLVPAFLRRYPKVDVQMVVTDRALDLFDEAIDLAIRVTETPPPGLAGRPVLKLRHLLCASPAYLAAHGGSPAQPRELAAHSCLFLGEDERDRHWRFRRGAQELTVRVSGRYVANHSEMRLEGALADLGIASLPEFCARAALQRGALQPVLADWEHLTEYSGTVWLLYPSQRHQAPKVRAWIDHLVEGLAEG